MSTKYEIVLWALRCCSAALDIIKNLWRKKPKPVDPPAAQKAIKRRRRKAPKPKSKRPAPHEEIIVERREVITTFRRVDHR